MTRLLSIGIDAVSTIIVLFPILLILRYTISTIIYLSAYRCR